MNAVPKRYEFSPGRPVKFILGVEPGSFWIECEVTAPPGAVGRSVDVYLDPDAVLQTLKEARRAAIRARKKTMTEDTRGA